MKSLLICTEQFTLGGLETHIRSEIEHLTEAGVVVHLAVGESFGDGLLPSGLTTITQGLPLGPDCSSEALLTVINRLRQIIRQHSIEYVHVHPFTSIIPAVIAAELERVPYAITLHGPASLASYGPIYDLLFKDIILPTAPMIVAVSAEVQNLLTIHAPTESVFYIPNAVNFEDADGTTFAANAVDDRWLVVSRFDEFKIHGIVDFCNKAKACGVPGLVIVGDGPAKQQLCQLIEEQGVSDYVELTGPSTEVPSLIRRFSGVAGMGRVVLEGIRALKPVVLVGYDGVKGSVDKQFLEKAAECNFSGRNLPTIDSTELLSQLQGKKRKGEISEVFDFARTHFNAHDTWTRFFNEMASLSAPSPTVLIGLYHSLCGSAINGKAPYLYDQSLLDRIEAVACSTNYYDQRLLAAVSFCRQKKVTSDANQALVDRDEEITTLNRTVADLDRQIADLTYSLRIADTRCNELMASTSWRITLPLRMAKPLLKVFTHDSARYSLFKSMYWRLPERLRILLNKQRHKFVSKRLRTAIRHASSPASDHLRDSKIETSWVARAKKFDKIAVIPCGFEFDEIVNQRPINAAKHYSSRGFLVLYIAWQWSPDDVLSKGCGEVFPNVIQVPLYEFLSSYQSLSLENTLGHYVITMPARQFVNMTDAWRSKGGILIYDIMDEWEEFSRVGQAPWYEKTTEDQLVLAADFVFAVSPALSRKFSHIRTDISIIGNGYSPSVLGTESKGVAGAVVGNSVVIGYFGHLTDAWFDWDLLFFVAAQAPYYEFEIIGYGEPDWVRRKINKFTNIKLLGKIHSADLHSYVCRWSVGIIPFVNSKLASAVDPIKIYEYLFFGLPSVVTGIDHLRTYPKTYLAEKSNMLDKISNAISDNSSEGTLEEFLKETTWECRFDSLLGIVSAKKRLSALYN